MKRYLLSLSVVAIVALLSLASCSKSSSPSPQQLMVGTWNLSTFTYMGTKVAASPFTATMQVTYNADSTGVFSVTTAGNTQSAPMVWNLTVQNNVKTLTVTPDGMSAMVVVLDSLTSTRMVGETNFSGVGNTTATFVKQ